MADGVFHYVVNLPAFSLIPVETVQQTFNVAVDGVITNLTDIAAISELIEDFYTNIGTGQTIAVGTYLGESINRSANAASIDCYATVDLDGSTPMGSPVHSQTWTVPTASAGDPYPEEVAAVLSYHGDLTDVPVEQANPTPPPATIRPQQRRRGRLYIGPLQVAAGATGANQSRPVAAFRTNCTVGFRLLAQAITAYNPIYSLGVWSKADADVYPVVAGWMDDAWDTQRRRGVEPTTRTTFTV